MEKLNPVSRQFPCNTSEQENKKQNNYSEAKTVFLERGRSFFRDIFSFSIL